MARSSLQKRKLLLLRSILLENTDETRFLTMKELIAHLAANGISAERKSIYDDIETLRVLGIDIQTVRGKSTGYYVASRRFEMPELKLLIDAVRASKLMPEAQSASLIEKLTELAPVHDRPSLNREVFVSNRAKTLDTDIFNTVDRIHEAIEKNLNISFKYFSWTVKKQKEYRKDGHTYSVSPWSLVWDDSHYYLVGFDTDRNEIRHYRVDKMESVAVTEAPRSGEEEFKRFDINSYSESVFGMFGGTPERVTLRCSNRLANVIIDRFGADVPILCDGDSFRTYINVVPSPVFLGWVISFGNDMEILSPEHIADELKKLKE